VVSYLELLDEDVILGLLDLEGETPGTCMQLASVIKGYACYDMMQF